MCASTLGRRAKLWGMFRNPHPQSVHKVSHCFLPLTWDRPQRSDMIKKSSISMDEMSPPTSHSSNFGCLLAGQNTIFCWLTSLILLVEPTPLYLFLKSSCYKGLGTAPLAFNDPTSSIFTAMLWSLVRSKRARLCAERKPQLDSMGTWRKTDVFFWKHVPSNPDVRPLPNHVTQHDSIDHGI